MRLDGRNIYIRFLEESDAEALTNLHIRNRDFFTKYSSTRSEEYYTLDYQRTLIKINIQRREKDEGYCFGVFKKEKDELIGTVALTEVLRGALQGCFIGYSLDFSHNGRGYMTEAVKLALEFAFNELHLHRIEAGVMPRNAASMRVLEKAGFKKEGISRKNVHINGKWEDHQLLAVLDEDFYN